MTNTNGSSQRVLRNRCTPMPVIRGSREAVSINSDRTPQQEINPTVEPPMIEVSDNTSVNGNCELSQTSSTNVRQKIKLYSIKESKSRKRSSKRKWTKDEYEIAVECKFQAEWEGVTRGVGRRAHELWIGKGMFDIDEKKLMNQIRIIVNKGWLTQVELENIRRRISERGQGVNEAEYIDVVDNVEMESIISGEGEAEEVVDEILEDAQILADVYEEDGQEDMERARMENENDERNQLTEEERKLLDRLNEIMRADDNGSVDIQNVNKRCDVNKLRKTTSNVNKLLKYIPVKGITDAKNLIYAASKLVVEIMDIKTNNDKSKKKKKDPFWKRRIQNDIKLLRKDLSKIVAWFQGKWRNCKIFEKKNLDKKYWLKAKGFKTVIEELKQRISSKSSKIKRYEKRIKQFHDNKLFKSDQNKFYKQLNGQETKTIPPNSDDATRFWTNIWGNKKNHNKEAEWIRHQKENMTELKQNNINITLEDVKERIKTMPNWKGAGPDKIQGFWIKNFSEIHTSLANCLQQCMEQSEVPNWLVEGRTILIMKDPTKGTDVGNYRPIACLNLLWKLLSGILSEKTYKFLDNNKLLPDEQKGCRKKCQGTKDQLAIDKCILKNCKRRKTNLSMA